MSNTLGIAKTWLRDARKGEQRLLGALAAADRPIKMFTSLRQARTWLGDQTT
jgi:hypothetical protein